MTGVIAVLISIISIALALISMRMGAKAREYKKLRYLLHRGYRIYQVEPTILIMSKSKDVRTLQGESRVYPAISIDEAYDIVRKQEGHQYDEPSRRLYKYKDQETRDRPDWSDEDLSKPPKYIQGGWK